MRFVYVFVLLSMLASMRLLVALIVVPRKLSR
jgi:hypothetical protein